MLREISTLKLGIVNIGSLVRKSQEFIDLLDDVNIKLLKAIEKYGPRNMMLISRATGIPKSTVYMRLRKIKEAGISFAPTVQASKMGLGIIYAIAVPYLGRLNIAYNALDLEWTYRLSIVNPFRPQIFVKAYYPYPHYDVITNYLEKLKDMRIIKSYKVFLVNDEMRTPKLDEKYYDLENKQVILPWGKWYDEIVSHTNANNQVAPLPLEDAEKYDLRVDKYDILITDYLMVDSSMDFVEIAKKIGLSPPTVRHHYIKHILRERIIVNYMPRFLLFHPSFGILAPMLVNFVDKKSMYSFVNTLWGSPIMELVSKIQGDFSIFATFNIPRTHEANLIEFIEMLVDENIVYSYKMFPIVPGTVSSWSLPVDNFVGGKWIMGYEEAKKKLKNLKSELARRRLAVIERTK